MKHYIYPLILALLAAPLSTLAQQAAPGTVPEWDEAVVEQFATIPVQESGRVKPLDTYAQFLMLRINGKRGITLENGQRLKPTEWLMTCLLYPEVAQDFRHFIVDNKEAVAAIGVPTHEGLRDRYSYNELLPGREKLYELARQYSEIDNKERSPIQQQILNLGNNVFEFDQIIHFFDFAESTFSVPAGTTLGNAFPEAEGVSFSEALNRAPQVLLELREKNQTLTPEVLDQEVRAFSALMNELDRAAMFSQVLAVLPPQNPDIKEWRSPADLLTASFDLSQPREDNAALLAKLENLYDTRNDRAAFAAAVNEFHTAVQEVASARGEYDKVPLEYFYYQSQLLFLSQWLYVLSFLFIAVTWLMRRRKWADWGGMIAVLLPTLLLIAGITLRCIIRERPPVSTLYETILFITAVAVLMTLIMEYINRQRIAIAVGSLLGVIGMFLAYRYELKEGVDTMPSLVAVLDTNFWLSTHVTTVTAGYAAGLLAGAIAHIYLFGKFFGFRKNDKNFYRNLGRMTYGVLAFGLIFATVGTILGGIWANYSWGRFWGWDPKENGALMIVLWSLVIFHARLGRYIGDLGTAVCSIILAMIVAFSWWGVNLLGVGLHSYGFTSGIMNLLMIYWLSECVVILFGLNVALRDRLKTQEA
jgi:ABC-type transport system involved in cytochrome c biogenesis permease subunit